ncbi:MAG: hypothetical protein ACP5LF_02130 [Nitrososphaeria archaeon]|nr:hypothetical protein [Conexivisphaerales archaeon]
MSKKGEEEAFENITENLDYYTRTEKGKEELLEAHKKREKRFIEELLKYYRPQRDVIWMSPYCKDCIYFVKKNSAVARCEYNDSKLVKPFYGTAIWKIVKDLASGKTTLEVEEIRWDEKWIDVANEEIENAMLKINEGKPYNCYVPKRSSDA